MGLVPRQSSTGGKTRLGGISKRGNQYLRWLMINGASANLLRSKATNADPWVIGLHRRRPSLVAKPQIFVDVGAPSSALNTIAPCRSEQSAKQFARQRTILVDPGDRWQFRQVRCIRQHAGKRHSARKPCEENFIHSAVQSAVDWDHWHVVFEQLRVFELVGALFLLESFPTAKRQAARLGSGRRYF